MYVRPVPRRSFLLASVAAHGLALALLPAVVQALSGIAVTRPLPPIYKVEIMRLRLPDKVFTVAAHSHREEEHKAARPAPAHHSEPSRPASEAGPRPPAKISSSLELAVTRHASDREPVILQPDQPPLPKLAIPVAPPVAFWTKAIPPAPRPQAVIPGRVHATAATPNLDAPPVLSPPNPQPLASDIAAALAAAQAPPKLALPNSSTNPVRIRGKSDAEIASFDVPGSDPVNLIYLAANATAQKQLDIPKGMQNTPASKADGENGMTTAAARAAESTNSGSNDTANSTSKTSSNSTSNTASNTSNTSSNIKRPSGSSVGAHDPEPAPSAGTAGTAPGAPSAAAASAAARAAADSSANGAAVLNSPPGKTAPAPVATTSANTAEPAAAHAPDRAPNSSAGVIRVAHPVNGNFDVVILQSVSRDDLPDVGGALSGNPVYTVYLKVGDEREWLLEYCVPANVTRTSPYQVNIDDSGAVSAPYPVTTVIPKNVVEMPHPKHLVLHGLLSTAGVFREITGPDAESPLVREVLPLLREWQFRPALRDRVPVEVEVLLIIPARS